MYLRWGLRWGLLCGVVARSGKVVSGAPPTVAVGSSSMTTTCAMARFAVLWARVLKRRAQGESDPMQDKISKLKNYKNKQGNLTPLPLPRRS